MHLETKEIQAIIVTGYDHLPWSGYFFLCLDDVLASKHWLAALTPDITVAAWEQDADCRTVKPRSATNLAFTCSGLRALGISPEVIATFPEPFQQGIADAELADKMGDNGASAPIHWEIGAPSQPQIHLLLIVEASTEAELELICAHHREQFCSFGLREVAPAQQGRPLEGQKEHFGFHDSISQPEIEGSPKRAEPGRDLIKAGEFILGYANEYGALPATPVVPTSEDPGGHLPILPSKATETGLPQDLKDLGRNGSYLVFRKLHQDVAGFRRFIATVPAALQALLAAKMVGRWPSGLPLVLAPEEDNPALAAPVPPNDFVYMEQDPYGYRCPLGAHVRRTNPRDAMENRAAADSLHDVRRHRILRRGAAYGMPLPEGVQDDDGEDRGLLFICINTDIRRQFEFIQRTWANNPVFNGLYADRDPLIGDNREPQEAPDDQPRNFTIQREGLRMRITEIPRLVTMRGGGYFFVPSIAALRFLCRTEK